MALLDDGLEQLELLFQALGERRFRITPARAVRRRPQGRAA
jgi:hypothetical protein